MKIDFPMIFEKWPESLPHDQDRAEVRIMSWMITGGYCYSLLKALFYMAAVPTAPMNRVAALVSREGVMLLFLTFAICALPHLFVLTFKPDMLYRKLPRKMLVIAGLLSGVLWEYLAVLALPLDYGGLSAVYAFNGFCCLMVGAVFGFSLNCQQLRHMVRLREHEKQTAHI